MSKNQRGTNVPTRHPRHAAMSALHKLAGTHAAEADAIRVYLCSLEKSEADARRQLWEIQRTTTANVNPLFQADGD